MKELVARALWIAVAVLLPVAWAAVWVGHRVHVRLSAATVARAVGAAASTPAGVE